MAAHGARRLLHMAENADRGRRHRAAGRRAGLRLPRAADVQRAAGSRPRRCCARKVPHLDDRPLLAIPTWRRRSRWCASARSSSAAARSASARRCGRRSMNAWSKSVAARRRSSSACRTPAPMSRRYLGSGSTPLAGCSPTPTGRSTSSMTACCPSATTVRATFHRYVIDVNRDPSGASALSRPDDDRAVPDRFRRRAALIGRRGAGPRPRSRAGVEPSSTRPIMPRSRPRSRG